MARDKAALLYAETHEWSDVVEVDGQKVATIGISDFAIEQLNDLVFMDLPEVGKVVTAGEVFGEVESVKAVSDLISPVDGEVIEVHSDLPDNLDQLNEDPYDYGWIIKVRLADETSLQTLMDFAAYQKQCAEAG